MFEMFKKPAAETTGEGVDLLAQVKEMIAADPRLAAAPKIQELLANDFEGIDDPVAFVTAILANTENFTNPMTPEDLSGVEKRAAENVVVHSGEKSTNEMRQ